MGFFLGVGYAINKGYSASLEVYENIWYLWPVSMWVSTYITTEIAENKAPFIQLGYKTEGLVFASFSFTYSDENKVLLLGDGDVFFGYNNIYNNVEYTTHSKFQIQFALGLNLNKLGLNLNKYISFYGISGIKHYKLNIEYFDISEDAFRVFLGTGTEIKLGKTTYIFAEFTEEMKQNDTIDVNYYPLKFVASDTSKVRSLKIGLRFYSL